MTTCNNTVIPIFECCVLHNDYARRSPRDMLVLADSGAVVSQMVHTQYQQPYSEVDGLATLLKYPIQNAGGCKVCLSQPPARVAVAGQIATAELLAFAFSCCCCVCVSVCCHTD